MGRPNIKAERREQILDAYEDCVARFGVEGATLERIASTADLARPLIRHNVGNREALLSALVDRFLTRSDESVNEMIASLPEENRALALLDTLFDPAYSDANFVLVSEALIAASQHDPELARRMRAWTVDFVKTVERVLIDDYPDTEPARLEAVAVGVTGIYFNADSLTPLGPMTQLRKAAYRAALLLLESLKA